jgi:parallel beta-helix repeat protein
MFQPLSQLLRRLRASMDLPVGKRRRRGRRFAPQLEALEDRLAPAVVTNNMDLDQFGQTSAGSLRAAIEIANSSTDRAITFDLDPQQGLVISPNAALPTIVNPGVTIDGFSQPGTPAGVFGIVGVSGGLDFGPTATGGEVQGLNITTSGDAILLESSNNVIHNNRLTSSQNGVRIIGGASANVVRNNLLSGNGGAGVVISDAGTTANQISDNQIGINDFLGDLAEGNSRGVLIQRGATGNFIGIAHHGNTIAGNGYGVEITDPATTGNIVAGNEIGCATTAETGGIIDFSGPTAPVSNTFAGVYITDGAGGNIIGNTGDAEGNVISGNGIDGVPGVAVVNAGAANVVQNNLIGTNGAGTGASNSFGSLDNSIGVQLSGSSTVGTRVLHNLISNNASDGVQLLDFTSGNLIQGNSIGINAAATAPLGNGLYGVHLFLEANHNTINDNTIGGNGQPAAIGPGGTGAGVYIQGDGTTANVVQSNSIGTAVFPNEGNGVDITGASGNTLLSNVIADNASHGVEINTGTANIVDQNRLIFNLEDGLVLLSATGTDVEGNLISGNQIEGVEVTGGTTTTMLKGNLIGTTPDGTAEVDAAGTHWGNLVQGVLIQISSNNTVTGNTISGNHQNGVIISDPSGFNGLNQETGNLIQSNNIGTDNSGTNPVPNRGDGVGLFGQGVSGNTIDSNTVEFNVSNGVDLASRAEGNTVSTNRLQANQGDGVQFQGSAFTNTVSGNFISANALNGVELRDGANANTVKSNYIGTDVTGLLAQGNTLDGVLINGAGNAVANNVILANVVSANSQAGIVLLTTSGNLIQNNLVGTNKNGTAPLPNTLDGILLGIPGQAATANNVFSNIVDFNKASGVDINVGSGNVVNGNFINSNVLDGVLIFTGSHDNTVGGTKTTDRNFIGGNGDNGVEITGTGATANLVEGNYIGTDTTGNVALANRANGVLIASAGNTVGGTAAGSGNVISGNQADGVHITATDTTGILVAGNFIGTSADGTTALANGGTGINLTGGTVSGNVVSGNAHDGITVSSGVALIQSNFIGTNAAGTAALPNGGNGITVNNRSGETIGGTTAGQGNIVSGNRGDGIDIVGANASGTLVQGNFVGLDSTGSHALANTGSGIAVQSNAGATTISNNVVSGNGQDGLLLDTGTHDNIVQNNFLGTDSTGSHALGNAGNGVDVVGSAGNRIGGATAAQRNVISGNGGDGVFITGSAASANWVQGNYIGTNAAGTAALANSIGIGLDGAPNTLIGGLISGAGNVVSGNAGAGIDLKGTALNTAFQGNLIGLDNTGNNAIGNGLGVKVENANNIIGGTTAAARNVVSGNVGDGIFITGSAAANLIEGDFIGTNLAGTKAVGNGAAGLEIGNAATATTVGGATGSGAGNLISGNLVAGLLISGASNANTITGNLIGTDATGTAALGNGDGVVLGLPGQTASSNTISANTIDFNNANGVHLVAGTGNTLTGNTIASNILDGVRFESGAGTNAVGGTANSAANTITNNGRDGVQVDASSRNSIRENVISGNANLGIELSHNGNAGIAAPVLTVARIGSNQTTIQGQLTGGLAGGVLEVFMADSSASPQASKFLGSGTVTADPTGAFTFILPVQLADATPVVVTITDSNGNTSQFSAKVSASALPLGFSYDPVTQILTITGTQASNSFNFSQASSMDGSNTLHTVYTFTLNGKTASFPDTALTKVVVTAQGVGNTAILITNDTYVDNRGATQETAESISLGSKTDAGVGTMQKPDAHGNLHAFLTLSGFSTSYAYVGRNDGTVNLFGTAGVPYNGFVSAGNYSYVGGPGLFHLAQGASSVYGYSAGQPTDFAYHYSANPGSAFVVSGTAFSYMSTTDTVNSVTAPYFNVGVGFIQNTGVSKNAGQDYAYIIDSPVNDTFIGGMSYSYMYSTNAAGNFTEFDAAFAFALVFGESFVGGNDTAVNNDPNKNILAGFH